MQVKRGFRATATVVGLIVAAAGCGSEPVQGPDATSLAETFRERVDEIASTQGTSSLDDVDCFVIDREGVAVIVEAGDFGDVEEAGTTVVRDESIDELVQRCEFTSVTATEDGALVAVAAGTISLSRDEYEQRIVEPLEGVSIYEGESPGLDEANLVAVGVPGVWQFAWIRDGFSISVTLLFGNDDAEILNPDEVERGFLVLSETVDEVARSIRTDG